MITPPEIFDRALWRQNLRRVASAGEACDFLLARAAEDLAFRLAPVERPFPRALALGLPHRALAGLLAAPGRQLTLAAPIFAPDVDLVVDEEALPFAPQKFDLAVSLLSLHFANDLPGVFAQIRRCLAPDGLFVAALIGGQSLTELRQSFAEAEAEILGGASPHVAPFVDLRDLGGLLQRAGFALPVTDCDSFVVRYRDIFGLVADLRAMGATNVMTARAKTPLRRDIFLRMAQIYAEKFSDADGKIRASFEIIWASGWSPHESQQKPLAPGAATTPLSAALGDKSRDF